LSSRREPAARSRTRERRDEAGVELAEALAAYEREERVDRGFVLVELAGLARQQGRPRR